MKKVINYKKIIKSIVYIRVCITFKKGNSLLTYYLFITF